MATTIISHALCCAEKISETNDDKNSCANISDKDLEIFMGALCSAHIHVMFNTTYYCDLMCPHCHYALNTIMTFDCNGYVNLADAHNPENINKFKTTYKNPNGTFKILPEIHADLALELINHFYGNGK